MTKAIPAITPKERKAVTKMLNKYSMVWRTPTDYFKKYEAALSAAEARIERLEAALEPFKRAADAIDALDPSFPDHAAACRASFDYYQRHLGRDNSEEVTRHSVTAGDFRRARAALEGEKP